MTVIDIKYLLLKYVLELYQTNFRLNRYTIVLRKYSAEINREDVHKYKPFWKIVQVCQCFHQSQQRVSRQPEVTHIIILRFSHILHYQILSHEIAMNK